MHTFVTAMILADIQCNDNPMCLNTWSQLSGLSTGDLKEMRRIFLQILNHNLHIESEEYNKWVDSVNTLVTFSGSLQVPLTPTEYSFPSRDLLPYNFDPRMVQMGSF